jgi:hypothetical protein
MRIFAGRFADDQPSSEYADRPALAHRGGLRGEHLNNKMSTSRETR